MSATSGTRAKPAAVNRAFTRARQARLPYLLNVGISGVRSPFADWQLSRKK